MSRCSMSLVITFPINASGDLYCNFGAESIILWKLDLNSPSQSAIFDIDISDTRIIGIYEVAEAELLLVNDSNNQCASANDLHACLLTQLDKHAGSGVSKP
ncbi:hypothetical protein V6N13_027672 [Hibiscus sabdariffa]|uniref:Uncharacterized protein n=1 Tax=Hibiscus sabdariffa TaxID=183260 RepID=A0ABR2CF92_9ROSI